jgi:DNA helicase-2/ATP-dependent DNA helicase PcrA
MTLHNAKGLEFPIVFIAGLEDGIFPHYRSMGDPGQLEEERRLAYVGVTRARERLYLCHAWSRTLFGASAYNPPSRFLGEIPDDLVHAIETEGPGRSVRTWAGGRGRETNRGLATASLGGAASERAGAVAAGVEPLAVTPGETVVHDRWGEGVVLSVSGSGSDAQATIAFADVGEKRVLLAYAPLARR